MKQAELSKKLISRLTLYHSILKDCREKGDGFITSTYMAELLHISASQIRKDIGELSYTGVCKRGYNTEELLSLIEKKLSFSESKDVYIVGAGNLGIALARNHNFDYYGFNIKALFDNNPIKVGLKIGDKEVFHISSLKEMAERDSVKIAVLTVPYSEAQNITTLLIDAGIKYIWNFTEHIPEVPDGVKIWNENLIGHFLQLCK